MRRASKSFLITIFACLFGSDPIAATSAEPQKSQVQIRDSRTKSDASLQKITEAETGYFRERPEPQEPNSISELDIKNQNNGFGPFDLEVNCKKGESLAAVLSRFKRLNRPLTVTIFGVCTEEVVITQDEIMLQGAAPGDGLEAPSATSRPLTISGARLINLYQLTLTGGSTSLYATAGAQFSAANLFVSGATNNGIHLNQNSAGSLNNSTLDNNANGILVAAGGALFVSGGVVDNTAFFGVTATLGGSVDLRNGLVVRNSTLIGLFADNGGSLNVADTTVEGSDTGVQVNQGGSANFSNGTLIRANRRLGVAVHGATISLFGDVIIADNTGVGIGLFNGSRAAFNGVIIERTDGTGVLLLGGASIRTSGPGNIIQNNSGNGISIQDTSVGELLDGASTQIIDNGGVGIFCQPAPAVAQINGIPGTVSGNAGGQINCPGVVIP